MPITNSSALAGLAHRLSFIQAARGPTLSSVVVMQSLLAASFLTVCPPVQAQLALPERPAPPVPSEPQEAPYGLSGRIGVGVVNLPTYEGSPNRRTLVVPDLTLSYRTRAWGSVDLNPRGLFWNAVEAGRFRFALVAQFDPGRKDIDTKTLDPTPGDARLADMGRVKSRTEAGVGIGYGPVMVVARQAVGGGGAKGAQVEMSADLPWQVSDRLGLHFAVGATWADRDALQTYFGVTAAQSQATSFAVYTPKSGCRKVEASVGAEYTLAPSWKLQANLAFIQLGDEAAASPLVSRRNDALAALGLAYAF